MLTKIELIRHLVTQTWNTNFIGARTDETRWQTCTISPLYDHLKHFVKTLKFIFVFVREASIYFRIIYSLCQERRKQGLWAKYSFQQDKMQPLWLCRHCPTLQRSQVPYSAVKGIIVAAVKHKVFCTVGNNMPMAYNVSVPLCYKVDAQRRPWSLYCTFRALCAHVLRLSPRNNCIWYATEDHPHLCNAIFMFSSYQHGGSANLWGGAESIMLCVSETLCNNISSKIFKY